MEKSGTACITFLVIQACVFVALYDFIPFDAVVRRFTSYNDKDILSLNAIPILVSKETSAHKEILEDFGNVSQNNTTTSESVIPEVDTINVNKVLICQKPTGRLGNQMFDFASALGIAHALNYKFIMRSPHPLLSYFEINQTLAGDLKNIKGISIFQWRQRTWDKTYLSHNLTLKRCWRVGSILTVLPTK